MTTPQEAIQKVDLVQLAFELSQLAVDLLGGKQVEMETHTVTIQVPKRISNVIKQVVDGSGITLEQVYSRMASQGLGSSLTSLVSKATGPGTPQATKSGELPTELASNPALQGLQEKMSKLGEVVKQFESLSKVVENAANNIPKNNKDST